MRWTSWLSLVLCLVVTVHIVHAGGAAAPAYSYMLRLGEQSFDPLEDGVPAVPEGLGTVRDTGTDLRVVQLWGPTEAGWIESLERRGVKVVQYIHPFTYIVWGDPGQLNSVRAGWEVRWAGDFLPAYRLLPAARNLDETVIPVRVLMIRAADTAAVVTSIASLGARVDEPVALDGRFEIVGCDLPGNQLDVIARIPGVYSVQTVPTDGGLRGEMSNQVCANNVAPNNQAFPGYQTWLASVGLTGAGVIIANVDGGVQETHPDLAGRMLGCVGQTCGGSSANAHGTHTAGIMAADGASGTLDGYGFLRGLGVAPGANLVEQVYSPWYQQTGGMRLLMKESYNNGASLSGNSWGPSGTPHGYDNNTMQVDLGVRDADEQTPGNQPLTFVLSFMNGYGGTSSQGTPDEAKNIFTIGSTKMQTTGGEQILEIDDLSSNSAHGPALDGRTIPHMVAPGCNVDSTVINSSHGLMCGTSMSSPHVSGAVALFIEYYRGLPTYTVDPSPALIKAAFLPVAHDLAGHLDADGGVLGRPFDSKQGWGRMNLPAVVAPQVMVRYFDNPTIFTTTGQEWTQTVTAGDPSQPLRIMLVWTDAAGHGLGGSTPAWNNDLDLVVEDGANVYRGNVFGSTGWSITGGSADYRNNTEGVFIGPSAPGAYTIRVVASNINSDGIPNYGGPIDQDFALVCYNCAVEPGFTLAATPAVQELCVPGDAQYQVDLDQIMGFADPVTLSAAGLPAGVTAQFSVNPVTPPGSTVLTLTAAAGAYAGEHAFDVVGQSGSLQRSTQATLWLYDAVPPGPALLTPANGATGTAVRPEFTWSAAAQAATYALEIATDAGFANVVATDSGLTGTTFTPPADLAIGTTHYWRVWAENLCGTGAYSATFSFTTRVIPAILLVDDDDNNPNVRSYYTDALAALGLDYDLWDTNNSDTEPSAAELSPYATVIWFTGDEFGGVCGPGTAGEAALSTFLAGGKNLLLSSQDYHYDRQLTSLMTGCLGVASVINDRNQTTVTGTGPVFAGLGPYTLSYPFSNYSDELTAGNGGQVAFNGDRGTAAVCKDTPVYRTMYLGFPFEAISPVNNRAAVLAAALNWFRPYVDCNTNGVADHVDIHNGTSLDANGNGIPDECEQPQVCAGDANCDAVINWRDIDYFVAAMNDNQAAWAALFAPGTPACGFANNDVNSDGAVNWRDIDPLVAVMNTTCP